MGIKTKTYYTRYLTYYLEFPGDRQDQYWVKQIPFIHDIQFEMRNWKGVNADPKAVRDLLRSGETHWRDHNGVTHRLCIEEQARPERWGVQKPTTLQEVKHGRK